MSKRSESKPAHTHGPHERGHGPSSFRMHDPDLVFDRLGLKVGDAFVDLGCGPGDYSIQASRIVGDSGTVYALDKWKYLIDGLTKDADSLGVTNIKAMVADITEPLPMEDDTVDVCFLATVLHTFNSAGDARRLFSEIHRVLRPTGRVAIIECKKEDQPFGPPKHMRLSPEQVADFLMPCGFEKISLVDLGFNYMILFRIDSDYPDATSHPSLVQ